MTIASTIQSELTIGKIIRMAYRRASLKGVEELLTAAESGAGRDALHLTMSWLTSKGIRGRLLRLVEVPIVADTQEYALPTGYSDAVMTAAYEEEGETFSTVLQPITIEEWNAQGAKEEPSSTPALYWVDKSYTPPVVHLWPIPDRAGTITFQGVRSFAAIDSDEYTVDLQDFWLPFLVSDVASSLAQDAGLAQKFVALKQEAMAYFESAHAESSPSTNDAFYPDYGVRTQ